MSSTVIVDYGMANLRSVQKAIEKVGHQATITQDQDVIRKADRLILPGVGAFRDAIALLKETQLDQVILEYVRSGRKFLGICLGLQLLFSRSYEEGTHEGLNLFEGDVVRFNESPGLKIPHMGWNQIHFKRRPECLPESLEAKDVYFVHSYYVVPARKEITMCETEYPTPFVSGIWHENVMATQFHPEKSQKVGAAILKAFMEWN